MTPSERVPNANSSWNDDMPWGFYARRMAQQKAAEEAALEVERQEAGTEVPPEAAVDIDDDARANHAQYKERTW